MATRPSVRDLFARLALHLQLPINERESEKEALDLAILKLNESLNLNETPNSGIRVLDAALSLMCFKAPQVFDSVIEYLVRTIVSILSSSVNCEVFQFQNEEFLLIGSASLNQNCVELIEMCNNVYPKLEQKGIYSHSLLRAVVRMAALASYSQYFFPFIPTLDVKSQEARATATSKLQSLLPADQSIENEEIPLRLLFWYLDPLTLKQAASNILQETNGRPFLCLSEEFRKRLDWRTIFICLALSPVMFIETRALLHKWFLKTGLASVLELLVGLVSAILDVISRPTWWGISTELGSKLPFSSAYFPNKNNLFSILSGVYSAENFLRLVHATSEQQYQVVKPHAVDISSIDHKSLWSLAIDFPDWLYFASFLLFSEKSLQKNIKTKGALASLQAGEINDRKLLSASAARYIAWILIPVSKFNQDLLVDFLTNISESWDPKQFTSREKEQVACKKKLKKPKLHDKREDYALEKEYDCQKIRIWLNEIEKIYLQYANETVNSSASASSNASHVSLQKNVLLRRILLGTLIGCPDCISEDCCGLLLHYAATGRTLKPREMMTVGLKHEKKKSDGQDLTSSMDNCSKRDAIAGACLVFSLTDAVDSISDSLFDTEEIALEFIDQVKVKPGKYLVKCIKMLSQFSIDKDEVLMLRDLFSRLERWRHQGRETLKVQKDIDDVINDLSLKLSSFEEIL